MSWYDPSTWDARDVASAALGPMGISANALSGGFGGSGGKGGGKGGGAPSAPDFAAAAEAQANSQRVNQTNPFGASTSWTQGPDGRWSQSSQFSGPLAGAVAGLEGRIGDPASRQHATDAAYGQMTSRLDPQWQQREQQERSTLAAQGLDPGSEAYNNEWGNFSRGRNDAYQGALNNAVQQGRQEEMLPYQELSSLRGLSSQAQLPGATQYLPAAMAGYQGALQGYGIDQAGKNSKMNGVAGMAPLAALSF